MSDGPTVISDFPAQPRRVFTRPDAVLCARTPADVRPVIAHAARAARAGRCVAGFVSYEAAPAFEPVMRVRGGGRLPLAWFGVFSSATAQAPQAPAGAPLDWRSTPGPAAFRVAVERIREEIAAGRTYQVNLTARFYATLGQHPLMLYEALRRAQGSGYHIYIDTGDAVVLCASPELFFETRGRLIRTRPMKGTRPRGRWPEEDEALARELAGSEKDHAENLMIVDMLRSDLGRIARTGSVTVSSLFRVEAYRTVHQMTSEIEAELRDDVGLEEIFAALFPCGSVTGAPKISTMQLIAELEAAPREVYCGAAGVIEPDGTATFCVPIRTAWLDCATREVVYGAGAGITFDSDARTEYAETLAKAAIITEAWPDFELLETMRVAGGIAVRCAQHVARLKCSAAYFDYPFDETAILSAITCAAAAVVEPARLRLLLNAFGEVRTEVHALERVDSPVVVLAAEPVCARDRFLYHKTTHRAMYERHRARQPDGWDVLLWNEDGELTEFTRGNVVVDRGGQLLTPPRQSGLLAGIFRAELLAAGVIRERVIKKADLADAQRVWFVNSLREWVAVSLEV